MIRLRSPPDAAPSPTIDAAAAAAVAAAAAAADVAAADSRDAAAAAYRRQFGDEATMMDIDDGDGAVDSSSSVDGCAKMEVDAITTTAAVVQLCDRLDGRAYCTRPSVTIPSLILPSTISIRTHSHFHVQKLPSPTASLTKQVSRGKKHNSHTQTTRIPPARITLSACVMPNSVWPEQVIKARYTTAQVHDKNIAFASRLQHAPVVRAKPQCLSRVQKCLTNIQTKHPSFLELQQRSILEHKVIDFPMHFAAQSA